MTAREHAAIWAIFIALTMAHTFPMWLSPGSVLNELWDVRLNTWTMAWDAHALLYDPLSIFDANIFHPHANSLAFSENLLGLAVVVAPINWSGLPVLAYNIALLLAFAATGIATAYWVRDLTGRTDAGIVAGMAWAFAPVRFDHLPQIQLLAAPWAPLALLALAKYTRSRRTPHLLAASFLLAWQYAAGVQLTLLLLPLAAIVAFHLFAPHWRDFASLRSLGQVAVAGALFVTLTAPISLPYLEARDAEGFVRLLEDTQAYSAKPRSLLSPSGFQQAAHMRTLHRQYRVVEGNFFPGVVFLALVVVGTGAALVEWRGRRSVASARATGAAPARRWLLRGAVLVSALGAVDYLLTLALAQWWGRPEWADTALHGLAATHPAIVLSVGVAAAMLSWMPGPEATPTARWTPILLGTAVLCFLLATGPSPTAWNSALGLGPFRLLYETAVPYQSIRSVGRFGLTAVLALSVVAGIGYSWLARRLTTRTIHRSALLAVVAMAMFAEVRVMPFPTVDARPADLALYERLAMLPGRGPVVHVPLVPKGFPAAATEYMLGSTLHWRPLVNGYSGFTPPDLVQLGTLPPLSDAFFDALREEFAVEWVAVHGRYLERFEEIEPTLLGRSDLELVERWGDTMLFRFRPPPERGGVVTRRVAAWQLEGPGDLRFRIRSAPGAPSARRVDLRAERGLVGEVEVDGRFREVRADLPEIAPAPDGTVTLTWRGDPETTPDLAVGETGTALRTDVLVDAQGGWTGIALDDHFVRREYEPGALVVALADEGRSVLLARRFDLDDAGRRSLLRTVRALPPKAVVALALRAPQGGQVAIAGLMDSLEAIGAGGPQAPGFAHRAAILGAVGAPTGTALQQYGGGRAFVRGGPFVELYPRFVLEELRLPYDGGGS